MSTLVLLRHGESTWNLENRFTGWHDVPLSERGVKEAHDAAPLLSEAGIEPGMLHTSLLRRAIQTADICLDDMGRSWIPVARSWRLNERHYGALEGLNKSETTEKYGEDQVKVWRRSYATPPPALEADDPRHPRFDPRYRDLPPDVLPAAESLKDVVERMLPYWQDAVVRDLRLGRAVMLAAHGNSLRALVMHLHELSEDEVVALNIPTGIPIVYRLDDDLRVADLGSPDDHYLGDPALVAAKAQAVAAQAIAGRPQT
ncbi:MAG TPA: 2,3-diphosphoglycerate-dependent phosphoglycerate mutase [Candidatus Dormibacteraeota bacterium]|jgi:2,3-bisphosphoglycerate-dependent phosphoglycerate mutase|nr:2,3-diphosphoglycerate-dependent phosphoglycerate mutase [Candidatus Dormibacteraeota bacterium]